MATYIVGDVQGCFASLQALLEEVGFGAQDALWCVGDLVNRGPDSLGVLRFARDLGPRFLCTLGNHDLHWLAMIYGGHPHRPGDTLQALLEAPDRLALAEWLRRQPLVAETDELLLVHAGIPPQWDISAARAAARELEDVLAGSECGAFFKAMYGNEPSLWDDVLRGPPRHRAIANYLTRMRLVAAQGRMEFSHKGGLDERPAGYQPWFRHPSRIDKTIVFGHWAALNGQTDSPRFVGLDTGCVWGRWMTAMRVEDRKLFRVPAAEPAFAAAAP